MVGIMTAIPGDTLQKQIERGEVFYTAGGETAISASGEYIYLISTGSKETTLFFNALSNMNLDLILKSGVSTSSDGTGPISPLNMNLNSSNTLITELYATPTITVAGTTKISSYLPNGVSVPLNPLSLEAGIILEPDTKYTLHVLNRADNDSTFWTTMFMREVS